MRNTFRHLPTNRDEMKLRGWDELDVLLITADAYIDHPTFGIPLIGRVLEAQGYRVGIIPQPDWVDTQDVERMGRPRLFCGISAGAMDSMINLYTSNKRLRDYDAYTPGGEPGMRPERATLVFSNLVRKAFPGLPVVLGGIEASLRRFTHFDYWDNKIRRSILFDSRADLLLFGMAEKAVVTLAKHLQQGGTIQSFGHIAGTARIQKDLSSLNGQKVLEVPSHEDVLKDKVAFNRAAVMIERESNPHNAPTLIQKCENRYVVVAPPSMPLTTPEFDAIFDLPFTKEPHPMYVQPIPAYEVIRFSVTINRGCFGGCSFCAITLQQGREIQSRSRESVKREVEGLKKLKGWAGTVSDLGGPSANMYQLKGRDESICHKCKKMSCVWPEICFNLDTNHQEQIRLMREVRQIPGVKHVFINSGIRYDLALEHPEYIREVATHHTSGILSVAPEHTDPKVLKMMKKPPIQAYNDFVEKFKKYSKEAGKNQYLSPYFISSFPGSDLNTTRTMSRYFESNNMKPEQIQDFIPTPMTLATAAYYTEMDPATGEPLKVEKTMSGRKLQKRTLQSFLAPGRVQAHRDRKKSGRASSTYVEDETCDSEDTLNING